MISDVSRVGDCQHRFEPAQDAVGAPVLRELDGRAHQIALMLVELGVEPLEQRERVGGGTREARENPIVMQPAHFFRALFDDDVAESDLAVAAHRDLRATPRGDDRRPVKDFHWVCLSVQPQNTA